MGHGLLFRINESDDSCGRRRPSNITAVTTTLRAASGVAVVVASLSYPRSSGHSTPRTLAPHLTRISRSAELCAAPVRLVCLFSIRRSQSFVLAFHIPTIIIYIISPAAAMVHGCHAQLLNVFFLAVETNGNRSVYMTNLMYVLGVTSVWATRWLKRWSDGRPWPPQLRRNTFHSFLLRHCQSPFSSTLPAADQSSSGAVQAYEPIR